LEERPENQAWDADYLWEVSAEGIPPFCRDYELIGWHANTKQMLKYYEKHIKIVGKEKDALQKVTSAF
jgi:hypothetical protein